MEKENKKDDQSSAKYQYIAAIIGENKFDVEF